MRQVEWIIIGAGPAGCSAALHLVQARPDCAGRILVLEAKQHPRPKLCGGGLTPMGLRILSDLGLSLAVPFQPVRRARFLCGPFSATLQGDPLFVVTRREELDAWLAGAVDTRGVELRENTRVLGIVPSKDGVEVETPEESFHSQAAVVGVGSRGLSLIASRPREADLGSRRVARAIEASLETADADWPYAQDEAVFDFTPTGDRLRGYAWAFPMPEEEPRRRLNVGVYEVAPHAAGASPRLGVVLASSLLRWGDLRADQAAGYPIRAFRPLARLSRPRVLLAGDAAGADPLFGEGIAIALGYGRAAARQLLEADQTGDYSFRGYRREILTGELGRYLLLRWAVARFGYPLARAPGFMRGVWALAAALAARWHPTAPLPVAPHS